MLRRPLIWLGLAAASLPAQGPADTPPSPIELGRVAWHRDFDAATEAARKSGKPLLVLFQEVPG